MLAALIPSIDFILNEPRDHVILFVPPLVWAWVLLQVLSPNHI